MKGINFVLLFLFVLLWTGCEKAGLKGSFVDDRDGERYKTIKIGDQEWMAENLRYNAPGSYLNPDNPSKKYGRIYEWAIAMDGDSSSATNPSGVKGICPEGWHLPSDEEWKTLEVSLGLTDGFQNGTGWRGSGQGTKLKSTTDWDDEGDGTNSSGFNAFPAGHRWPTTVSGNLTEIGKFTFFWSSTAFSETQAWYRYLHSEEEGIYRSTWSKYYSVSCRCVKDL